MKQYYISLSVIEKEEDATYEDSTTVSSVGFSLETKHNREEALGTFDALHSIVSRILKFGHLIK